ncbi:leucine efflux protein LeuE [Streptosporangium sp. NPDC048865]|uniref:leucine efflux protein LeuE n=1 Tax=Streptosporangium sp. NPDC048865 TaxID=3155766 RepID=UPI00343441E0
MRQGYRGAAGVFVGDTVLMVLAAAVASLPSSTPLLFDVVKYVGAAYLAWIGFQMLRSAWSSWRAPATVGETAKAAPARERTAESPFRKALVVSLMNPKAILFFISFFIRFVDPAYGTPALSFLILGAICQLFSVLYLSAPIFGGTFPARRFRARRRLSAGLRTGVGALFIGFGARPATATLT